MTPTAGALASTRQGLLSTARQRGVSREAETLLRQTREVRGELLRSITMRRTAVLALRALEFARVGASELNWDGSGGKPLDLGAYLQAHDFLSALPISTPVPDVSVDPDGEASVEWAFGPRMILTVSINGQGRLSYSAIVGVAKTRGTEWLVEGVPRQILDALGRLVEATDEQTPTAARA